MGAKTGSEAFTKEKDGVSQMQAIEFLKGQGYKIQNRSICTQ